MTSIWLGSAFAGASLFALGVGLFIGAVLALRFCTEGMKKAVEMKVEYEAVIEEQQKYIHEQKAAIARLQGETVTDKEALG
jgi:uncharacterized membrane-anchored protein YhcB (DUF1043 family)